MKRILGLDLGTTSIGWALVNEAESGDEQSSITHKDVSIAFGQTLTYSRISTLLKRLVEEGRLVREGKGSQTRYRLANEE